LAQTLCGFDDAPGVLGRDQLVSFGPTLLVRIGFDPTYDPKNVKNVPALPRQMLPALVDTGAQTSCIDSQLALTLNLPIVDRQKVSGVHGAHEVNVHLAQIHVPSLAYTIYGTFAAVHLVSGGQHHQALIGRTALQNFLMTYDGRTGTVMITNEI